MPIFKRLQKRRYHAGVFQEAMNCLKAHVIAVEQDRHPHDSHHDRVTMQYCERLAPIALRIIRDQEQVV